MTEEPSLRMRIHDYIRSHPAAHILEIADAFNLTHPTVMYHLDLLADEGWIVSDTWGKRRVHFPTESHFNAWEREVLALLASTEARSIMAFIAEKPGTFPREIARTLSVSDTTVKRYVPELLRLGIITELDRSFRRRLGLARNFPKRANGILEKVSPDTEAARRLTSLLPDKGEAGEGTRPPESAPLSDRAIYKT